MRCCPGVLPQVGRAPHVLLQANCMRIGRAPQVLPQAGCMSIVPTFVG